MIEVENLTKFYGPRPAIKNLTFQISKGEVVGFLGPNGAGKTTTMNILSCILPATSGTARICGYDVFENSLGVRKTLGYLPENLPLYSDMIVSDYLRFAAKIRSVKGKNLSSNVDRILEKCSLKEVRGRIIGRLSKGFQQRVGLAQALIHNPDILILDEPTLGLDPIQIIEIRKLIKELASEHTIILSSHILPEITEICKRVIIISEGVIAAMDSLDGLNAQLRKGDNLLLKIRNPNGTVLESLKGLEKICSVQTEDNIEFLIECELNSNLQDSIARTALEHSWGIVELKPIALSLEDIFLKLTLEEKEVGQ